MIIKESQMPEQTEEEIEYKKLIEDFNKEAINQNSKYYLVMDGMYPHLCKPLLMNFGNKLGNIFIYYNSISDCFYFAGGIPRENYEEIRDILEKIKQKLEVEYL